METLMEIEIEFGENSFEAIARIVLGPRVDEKTFSFILNRDLQISKIECNGEHVSFQKTADEQPEFRAPSKRIAVHHSDRIEQIAISYSGAIAFSPQERSCWYNIITPDIKSLSSYSVWYPQATSAAIARDKVIVRAGEGYFVVKGDFDRSRNIWEYGGGGYDPYNIMAYRKEALHILSNPQINIYYVDQNIHSHAENAVAIYREILKFYNGTLFPQRDIPTLDIACASPAITIGGGYRRKDLMWCTTLGENTLETTWLFAHETAHIWCSGAASDSWEDWLNESTAEWASLLFALHTNDASLFDFILKPKLEKWRSLPPIQTADGSRPDGVHIRGTILLYEMYQSLGVEAILKVVRLFAEMENKTTASLLQQLYDKNENAIADFIREGIKSS